MNEELVHLSSEELSEFYRMNRQIIARLEEEARMLKKQIKDFGPAAEFALGLNIIERADGWTNLEEIKSTLQNDIENLQSRLDETESLTGISISNVEESVKLQDDHYCKSIGLALKVLGHDLLLKCEIGNITGNVSEKDSELEGGIVRWLEMQIPREMNDVISDAITPIIQEVSIHPTLCVVKSYLQCSAERDRLLDHFGQLYLDSVHYWEGKSGQGSLKISTQDPRQPDFVMEWELVLQENSRYKNDVRLVVNVSDECKKKSAGGQGVLDTAPEMFAHMTSLLGLEKAMDRFIRMVLSQGEDIIVSSAEFQALQKSSLGD